MLNKINGFKNMLSYDTMMLHTNLFGSMPLEPHSNLSNARDLRTKWNLLVVVKTHSFLLIRTVGM